MEQFRAQAAVDAAIPEAAVPDFDAFAAVLAARRAGALDVAVDGQLSAKLRVDTPSRWDKLLTSLSRFLYEGVLCALEAEYQDTTKHVLAAEWSQDWARWDDLRQDVCSLFAENGESCLEEDAQLDLVLLARRHQPTDQLLHIFCSG